MSRRLLASVLVGVGLVTLLAGCPPTPEPIQPGPPPPEPPPTAPPTATATTPPAPAPTPGEVAFRKEIPIRQKQLLDAELFRKNLILSFGFQDDPNSCIAPPPLDAAAIDIDKSLIIHDTDTLGSATGPFKLRRTLDQLAAQAAPSAPGTTAATIFRDLWDTQNPAPGAGGSEHCDDNPSPVPAPGVGGLNGYPVHCRPQDGAQASVAATDIDKYRPIALINRLDLAHEGWRNCGEHRIIYGRTDNLPTHRNFIIFEAVLPNPKPGCRSACKPVMEFWAGLSTLTSAARQDKLAKFYYQSGFLPGFQPVVHIDHYTAKGVGSTYGSSGSGQIRTNQFFEFPWLLKEFHLLLDCGATPCSFGVMPSMVKVNPFGDLWNGTVPGSASPFAANATSFEADLLAGSPSAVQSLASPTFDGIGYPVDLNFDAAESNSLNGTPPDNYLQEFQAGAGSAFNTDLNTAATAAGRTPDQIVHRAVGLSCAGCHQPSVFGLTSPGAIGAATLVDGTTRDTWPDSLGFVHVGENASGTTFPLSPALTSVFLPSRKANLVTQLQQETCLCEQKFVKLGPPQRSKALQIQDALRAKLKPDIEKLRALVPKPGPRPPSPVESAATRTRIVTGVGATERKLDTQLAKSLKAEGIEVAPVTLDVKPQPDRLDAVKQAGGDAKKVRALRQQAVIDQLKSEPPRRTVTGSFRVH